MTDDRKLTVIGGSGNGKGRPTTISQRHGVEDPKDKRSTIKPTIIDKTGKR